MMTPIAPWLAAFVAASVMGSMLLLAGLAAVRMMRRASAEARHAAIALALLAFFILPLAGIFAPSWTLPVPASSNLVREVIGPAPSDAGSAAPSEPGVAPEIGNADNPAADPSPPSEPLASR